MKNSKGAMQLKLTFWMASNSSSGLILSK